uniref:Chitin-binding type-2 domain-containing protein n=1 Tax=Daphnia galeata TaxID=27404 RepID=A0A8J2S329_9CRUS|nr:unnamed protein product [Daphnia galeata]
MKQAIFALLSFIVLQVACASVVVPSPRLHNYKETFENFVCPEPNGVFPSETCSDYYLCVENVPYVQHCPGNSVFDPQTQVCVPPDGNSCQAVTTTRQTTTTTQTSTTKSSSTTFTTSPTTTTTTTSTTTTTPTTTTSAAFTCPSSNGFYPVPENLCSNLYYTCIGGDPYLSTCPGDSIFDPDSLVCVSSESASCSQNFKCPSANGSFPVPGECSSTFYTCISGTPYEQECPANEVFDPEIKHCVPYADASCNGLSTASPTTISSTSTTSSTVSSTTSRTTTPPSGEFTCPAPDGFFPHSWNVRQSVLYLCWWSSNPNGKSLLKYFKHVPDQQFLTHRPLPVWHLKMLLAVTWLLNLFLAQTFSCPTSEGFYPIPGTCGSDFYVCVSGSPYISTCPNGNIFDPETLICTPPSEATCCKSQSEAFREEVNHVKAIQVKSSNPLAVYNFKVCSDTKIKSIVCYPQK